MKKKLLETLVRNSPQEISSIKNHLKESKLSILYYIFFPFLQKRCTIDTFDDIQLLNINYNEKNSQYIEKLKSLQIPIPFLGLKNKIDLSSLPINVVRFNKDNSCFCLHIIPKIGYKTSYSTWHMCIEIADTKKRYIILVHEEDDNCLKSQGLNIDHNASVLKFVDEQLDTIWAYHKKRGVVKLG